MTDEKSTKMIVLTKRGVVELDVHNPAMRSTIASHWNATKSWLVRGDKTRLADFEETKVAGTAEVELESDPKQIKQWAESGEFEFEDIYST